jgi:hypothetical protein
MGFLDKAIGRVVEKQVSNQVRAEKSRLRKELSSKVKAIATENANLAAQIKRIHAGGWKSTFISDVYGEKVLYPHQEMSFSRRVYFYNSFVQAAADTLVDFLVGGEVTIKSKNPATQKFLSAYYEDSKLKSLTPEIFRDRIVFGNFYAEKVEVERGGKYQNKQVIMYRHIANPERVYHELDPNGYVIGYVIEVPAESYTGREFVHITYYGDMKTTVKGFRVAKETLIHSQLKKSTIPSYGRGAVATIINDAEVLLELERAMAVMARYKAIPKKLISTPGHNPKESEQLTASLNNLGDNENPVTNLTVKVDDLSYAGKDLNLQPLVDYLKRKLTVALAPEYIIHGEDTNRATSKEQKSGFYLRAKSARDEVRTFIEQELKNFLLNYPELYAPFTVEFGSFDPYEDETKREEALKAWVAGILTLNEVRKAFSLNADEALGNFYSFEVRASEPTQDSFGTTPSSDAGESDEDNRE